MSSSLVGVGSAAGVGKSEKGLVLSRSCLGGGGGGRPLLASGGWRLRGGGSSSFFRVHGLGERKREREWVRVAKSIARIFLGPGTPDFCNANLLYFIVFFFGGQRGDIFPGKTVLE